MSLPSLCRAVRGATLVIATLAAAPATARAQAAHGRAAASPSHGAAPAALRDVPRDPRAPGGLQLVRIPSHGERINAVLFRAAGAGAHPLLVLLHGFPGAEQSSDLAHAARRAGWHVVTPRYRGAWGSPGTYSWTHVLEDAAAVVAWARDDGVAREHGIDPRTIAVAGHSLGGFVALMTAARDPRIAGAASLAGFDFGAYVASARSDAAAVTRSAELWASSAEVLHGATGRALAEEAFAHGEEWDLRAAAPALVARPLLLVAADHDDVAPAALHHAPLVAALRARHAAALTTRTYDADHSLADVRIALAAEVVAWLGAIERAGDRQ